MRPGSLNVLPELTRRVAERFIELEWHGMDVNHLRLDLRIGPSN